MRPLEDLRVVDATSFISGPFAALCLADLGARVLKIEPPRGDPMRRFGVLHNGVNFSFAACNVNKVSRTLDLKRPSDVAQFRGILDDSDVLITNWRPGVAEDFGLGLDTIRDSYPKLIWVRISGYGQDGPFAGRPAFDTIIQARSGYAFSREGDAQLATGYLADKVTGILAAQAALAAVHSRETNNIGSIVDVAMLDAMAYFNGPDLFAGGLIKDTIEPAVMRHVCGPRPLPTKDGWIMVSPVSGQQLKSLLVAVDRPEWLDNLRNASDPATLILEMHRLLETVLPNHTTQEWERRMADADVPASAVISLEQHFEDPQVVHNQLYHDLEDPVFGTIRRLRYPALFDESAAETDDLAVPSLESIGESIDQSSGKSTT
jgi:crotonobetainyl-CoA:carnitine CoA-transferase CaiB-like acyl-CoA transferase